MALTNDWNSTYETVPADSDNASEGASKIRQLKKDTRERFNVDHYVGNTSIVSPSSTQISNSDTGFHRQVTLGEKSALPTAPSSTFAMMFALDANSDQYPCFFTDGSKLRSMQPMISRTAVSLTTVATTNLFLVPTGTQLLVTDIILQGKTAISGGTESVLKVGVSGTLDQLNTTTGHTFTSGTATSLLPANQRVRVSDLYPPTNMSTVSTKKFAAAAQLIADVSGGAPVTAGEVYVEIWGILIEA